MNAVTGSAGPVVVSGPTTPPRPAKGSGGYIAGLDGIRAVCVSLVMLGHFGFGRVVPGGLGVTIFFFLSGYLITTLLLEEKARHGTVSLGNFYARRFLRLAPEMMMLLLFGLTIGLLYMPARLIDVVTALTYTSNYYALYAEAFTHAFLRWPHLWSLAVEEHFYLTFPLIVMLIGHRPRALLTLLVATCVAVLAWRIAIVRGGAPFGFAELGVEHPYTYVATDTRFDSIAYGCATAVLLRLWSRRLQGVTPYLLLAVSAVLMLASLWVRGEAWRESWRYSVQGISAVLFFLPLFRSDIGSRIAGLLEWPVARQMGVLSYGAYLWHLEIAFLFAQEVGMPPDNASVLVKLLLTVVGFVFAFGMAQASLTATAPVRRLRARFHKAAVGGTADRPPAEGAASKSPF